MPRAEFRVRWAQMLGCCTQEMASFPEPRTAGFPDRVGRYELLLPIGTGGMATVFLARAQGVGGFQRDVALKLIHAHLRADEESKLHLLEEARLAARIRHPNVVPVLEVDEDPFGVFLVMDYVEGETLSGLMRAAAISKQPIPQRLIARILSDALSGLQAAHELKDERGETLGLVHRDFSPQNILVSVDGIARLSDFGIAKATSRAVRTKTGLVKGKISYMAPEQARGRDIDRRCDVWAAGVVAWELIAGQPMHSQEDDDVATLLRIVTEEPPRLRSVKPEVSVELERVVGEALTVDPTHRCPSADEFRKRLARAWEKDDGIADASELGAFVRQIVGEKLTERQKSIAEVRTLRARMVELARPGLDEPNTVKTPGSDSEPVTLHREAVQEQSRSAANQRVLGRLDVGLAEQLEAEQPERTEKVVRQHTPLPPRLSVDEPGYAEFSQADPSSGSNRRTLIVAIGLALSAAGIASLVIASRSGDESAPASAPPADDDVQQTRPLDKTPESASGNEESTASGGARDQPVLPSDLEPAAAQDSDAEPSQSASAKAGKPPTKTRTHKSERRVKSAPGQPSQAPAQKNRVLPPSVPPLAGDPY